MRKVNHRTVRNHLLDTFLYHTFQYDDENRGQWYECELDINDLYSSHIDYRGIPIHKNQRYVDIYNEMKVYGIENLPMFPKENFDKKNIICQKVDDRIYVLDGQTRVLTALHYGEEKVKAYLYEE